MHPAEEVFSLQDRPQNKVFVDTNTRKNKCTNSESCFWEFFLRLLQLQGTLQSTCTRISCRGYTLFSKEVAPKHKIKFCGRRVIKGAR